MQRGFSRSSPRSQREMNSTSHLLNPSYPPQGNFGSTSVSDSTKLFFLFKDLIYLSDRQRSQVGREAGREGRGEQAPCWAESPVQSLIPGPWDHDWAEGRCLTHWATQAPQCFIVFYADPITLFLVWCTVEPQDTDPGFSRSCVLLGNYQTAYCVKRPYVKVPCTVSGWHIVGHQKCPHFQLILY